jgi:hypothetical protein
MTTNSVSPPSVPRTRRLPSLLWLATMLLAAIVATGDSMQARCPDQKAGGSAWTMSAATPAVTAPAAVAGAPQAEAGRPVSTSLTTGLDLEVRIWNVRIGFPWLKSLPVTPGRRIVVSLWETESDR